MTTRWPSQFWSDPGQNQYDPDEIMSIGGDVGGVQVATQAQVDELSPLVDFGSASCPPGKNHAMFGTGRMPFNYKIGESKNVTFMDNMIRLDDVGLWSLQAMVTTSYVAAWDNPDCQVWLRVIKPDGGLHSVYRQQGYFMSTLKTTTMTLTSTVMVKEPGYFADVYAIANFGGRGWLTGPDWTNLSVQHINRGLTGGTGGESSSDEPDDPDDGATFATAPR